MLQKFCKRWISNELYRSAQSLFGDYDYGTIQLPKNFHQYLTSIIKDQDKATLRKDIDRIKNSLHSIGKGLEKPQKGPEPLEPHILEYGHRETMAYLASRFPSHYAVIYACLSQVKDRIPEFAPKTMMDFGCGPGTTLWALNHIYDTDTSVEQYFGVDLSAAMLDVLEDIQQKVFTESKTRMELKRYVPVTSKKFDLVVSSFALSELPSSAIREYTVEQLWERTKDILVLVDYGTQLGYDNIMMARDRILSGNRNAILSKKKQTKADAHILGPCPHELECPMKQKQAICKFRQQVRLPTDTMKVTNQIQSFTNTDYCYLILRKGKRPLNEGYTMNDSENLSEEDIQIGSYQWGRLIDEPLKRGNHSLLTTCSSNGQLERFIITKKQDTLMYRSARRIKKNDLWPYPIDENQKRISKENSKEDD